MEYKVCSRCVMDTSDSEIVFNEDGICNHCLRYDEEFPKRVYRGAIAKEKFDAVISKLKKGSKPGKYDCIIGVSGGVDSTYVAYLLKEQGVNPLAIHFDNGWNSELAVSNIEKTLDKLGIDLYTYVIDWTEFKDLQMSFLKASTPDGEVPSDHAINALLFKEASKRNIKYIVSGMNFATESITVPSWAYGHSDWKYIRSVHKKFGSKKLKTYPHFNFLNLIYWTFVKRIESVSILNYMEYNKEKVRNILETELGWVYYGGKHYESVYTRFYQGYILPRKFGIDKRKAHLSDLINDKQISKEEAVKELQKEPLDKEIVERDILFLLKKFNISRAEFDEIMNAPIKNFKDYPNKYSRVQRVKKIVNYFRSKGWYSK